MAERTREGAPETPLTSDELAARVGLKTRQSVHDWLKKGKIVGWRGAKRGYLFPAEQFDDRGRPVPGLDRVIGRFGDGYAAWVWLTTELASLDGATPLTLLADGEIERVAQARKVTGRAILRDQAVQERSSWRTREAALGLAEAGLLSKWTCANSTRCA